MSTATNKKIEDFPGYITPIQGKRTKVVGKVKIPHFNELPKVRGIFKNLEAPGTGVKFPCRFWKGAIMNFHLMDGEEYVIPRVVADHLNENCAYKEYHWKSEKGEYTQGKPVGIVRDGFKAMGENFHKEVARRTYRYMFQILGDA